MEHLAVKIRESYCQQDCCSSNSSTEYLSAEEELTQTVPLSSQLTPDRQGQLPSVQDHGEHSQTRRVGGEPKKQQEQGSVSATMGRPRPSNEVTLQKLVKRHSLTDIQLNCEIGKVDIPFLAKHFDKIELYMEVMNLCSAEQGDVVKTMHASGNQVAMTKCLSLWKGQISYNATYRALLEVLLRLEKGEVANNVCLYLAAKKESSGALNRESSSYRSDSSELSIPSDNAIDSVSLSDLQQKPYLRFECGCGQCTVHGFIIGETCPNPKAFPFPKLEIYGIPSHEIDYIEAKLYHQSTKLHRSFCELVLDTFNEMLERSVDIQKLIVYLKMILKPKWYFPSTSSQVLDCLNDLESFDDIAVHLTKQQYCSWFDYELIEHLRYKYLFTSSDSVLDDYKAKFKVYVSHRCFIYLNDEGPWPKHQVKVKCKLDFPYDQLSQNLLKHLKCVFADILGSPNYHLHFKQAREGCTELVFGAPPYFGEIRQLLKYQKSQLKAHGFLKVTIMEQNLFEVDSEEVKLKDTSERKLSHILDRSFNMEPSAEVPSQAVAITGLEDDKAQGILHEQVLVDSRDSFKKYMKNHVEILTQKMTAKNIISKRNVKTIQDADKDISTDVLMSIMKKKSLDKFITYLKLLLAISRQSEEQEKDAKMGAEKSLHLEATLQDDTKQLMRIMKDLLIKMNPAPGSELRTVVTEFVNFVSQDILSQSAVQL